MREVLELSASEFVAYLNSLNQILEEEKRLLDEEVKKHSRSYEDVR